MEICNPFKEAGEFKIVLAETVSLTDGKSADLVRKKDSIRRVRSKVDHGQRKEKTPSPVQAEEVSTDLDVIVNSEYTCCDILLLSLGLIRMKWSFKANFL